MNTEENPILGYRADGSPIRAAKRGQLTTRAFIHCSKCGSAICSHGGPSFGAFCVECARTDAHE